MPKGRQDSPFPEWMDKIISAEVNAAASILPTTGTNTDVKVGKGPLKRTWEGESLPKQQRTDNVAPKRPILRSEVPQTPAAKSAGNTAPSVDPVDKSKSFCIC